MRAIRYEAAAFGGPIEPVARELPDPKGAEVVVEISHCGVCHTDVHVHEGSYDLGGGRTMRFSERGVTPPITLGHEIVGRAVAAGPDATIELGTRVSVYPWIGCGNCFRCDEENDHLCADAAFLGIFRAGGYASHVTVPSPRYLVPIANIDSATAAPFACSGLTSFSAIRKIDATPRHAAVAVFGCGGLGLTAVALLKRTGYERVVALDPDAKKRALAKELGAETTLDPSELDGQALSTACGAPLLAALDFVGNESTTGLAIAALAKGGTLVIVGLFGGELRHPLPFFPVRALSVVGSYVGGLGELRDYVEHVRIHGAPALPTVTMPMSDAGAALSALAQGEIYGRAILVNEDAPA